MRHGIEEITKIATEFRRVFELKVVADAINLEEFPHGACGTASNILANYLQVNGFGGLDYVCGWRGGFSHGWLEWKGFIIDITADQFGDGMGPVVVTQDRKWHSRFSDEIERDDAGFCFDGNDFAEDLRRRVYDRIVEHLILPG
jgi:hypothetical protein